jgi:hypothetical protein
MRHLPRRRETMPATPGRPAHPAACCAAGPTRDALACVGASRLVSSLLACVLAILCECIWVREFLAALFSRCFPVKFAFLRKDLVVFLSTYGSAMRSRAPRCSCEFLFRKRALLTPTSRGCTLSKALQHAGDGRPTKDNECNAFRAPSHKTCANIQNHQE